MTLKQLLETGGSLNDYVERINSAWRKSREGQPEEWSYVCDISPDGFEDHAVVWFGEYANRKYYAVPFSVTDEAVTFAPADDWVTVKLAYVREEAPTADGEVVAESVIESIRGVLEAKADGSIDAVIVVEGLSYNKNEYTAAALQSGIAVFEGAPMFVDHPTKFEENQRPERSIRDLAGRVTGVHVGKNKEGNPALRGKVVISESAGWLKTLVKEGIAGDLSIRASGSGRRGNDGRFVVESFVSSPGTSVDFVTTASAGGEVELKESASLWKAVTKETIQQHRPDLVEELQEADGDALFIKVLKESGMKPEELKALQEANAALLEENTRLFREARTQQGQQLFTGLLAEAKTLPAAAREKLEKQVKPLIEAFATHGSKQTPDELKAVFAGLVEAEKDYLAKLVPNGVVSLGSGGTAKTEKDTTAALEEAFAGLVPVKYAKEAARGRRLDD
jgi:hypothetical protein